MKITLIRDEGGDEVVVQYKGGPPFTVPRKWLGPQLRSAVEPLPKRAGSVYVIASGDHIKIGFASDVGLRLRSLQTASALPLRLLSSFDGTVAKERTLHRRFASHRTQGEWFRHEGELAAWIADGCPL